MAIYADDFNRADGALTTPWVQIDGTLSITGGTVVGRTGNLDTARYNQTFAADQWVEADLTNQVLNTGVCGPMLRVTPGGDFYYFWMQTGTPVGIFRRVSNVYTQVGGPGAAVPTGPFKCRMEAQGTTLRMYVDGALWLTVTDPGGIANGQPGILGNGPGVLDNFRAGDLPYTPAVVPPTVVAATVTGGGVSQNVGTKPAGGQTGDYYLIWYSESDNPTPPAARACTGFTTESVMHGFPNQHQQWFWKAYTGTEGSTFTVTGNSTQWCGTGVFLLRGLPAGWTPRIVAPSAGTAQFAYTISSQAVVANTLMLLGQKDYDSVSTTPPAGLTLQASNGSHGLWSQSFVTAGTAGPYTITPGGPGTPNVTSQLFAEAVAATTTPVTASRTTTWNVAGGSAPLAFVGIGAQTTASASFPYPAGNTGDLLIFFWHSDTTTDTNPASAGWVSKVSGGYASAHGGVMILTAPSAAAGSAGPFTGLTTGSWVDGFVMRYANPNATQFDVIAAQSNLVGPNVSTTAITSVLGGIEIVAIDGDSGFSSAVTAPVNWTRRLQGNGNNWFCAENTAAIPAATSTGTQLFTSPSGNTAIYHVIIAPVSGGGGGTTPVGAVTRTTTWNVAAAAVPKVGPGADTTAGSGTSASSGTSLTVNHGVVDVGETLVVGVVADNVTNATLPTISSITKAAGETNNWVLIGSVDSSTATAGGGVRGMLYAITATVRWAAATQTITLSTAITAKAAVSRTFYGVTTTARGTVPSGTTGAAGVSTSGAPTATTAGTAIVAGDLVLGLAATESTTIPGLDSDTLNGSWVGFSAGLATSGNATTAVALRPQYKIVTAAGAQTFNPTCNTDSGVCVVGLVPQVLTGVTTTRATSWGVRANVTASRATTWVTKFAVTASRATTWNVAAASAGTSISENFNTGTVAADANFTNVLGTVVISGGKLVSGSPSGDVSARHNTHLSSVDHYAEATLTFGDPFGTYSGPCVRYSPSAQTYYAFRILNGGAVYFSRYEGGSETNLGSQSYTFVSGQTYVLRGEVQGTALRGYVNGALVYSTTDPGLPTGDQVGIHLYMHGDTASGAVDLFTADVLTSGTTRVTASRSTTWNVAAVPTGPVVINRGESMTTQGVQVGGTITLSHGAFTPAAGSLLVAMPSGQVKRDVGSGTATNALTDTFGDTGGTSWVLSATSNRGFVGTGQYGESCDIWTRRIGTGAGSGVITVTGSFGTSTDFLMWMQVAEVTGENTTTPVGATGSPSPQSGVTSFSITLSAAPAADSVVFSNFSQDYSPGGLLYIAPTGFTVLNDQYDAAFGQQSFVAAYKNGSAPTTVTWTGMDTTNRVMACAIEVKAAPTTTFDPTTPTGCSIWLDASDVSTFTFSSGSTVSAWRDKSGSARHTQTAAVSPVRGTVSLNGLPTVSFNGAAQVYTNNPGSYLTGTAVTAVAVCRITANSGNQRVISLSHAPSQDWNDVRGADAVSQSPGTEFPSAYRNGQMSQATSLNGNTWLIVYSIFDGTNHTMYVNNVAQTPVASTGAFSFDLISIGADDAGGTHLIGEVAEVVVYTQALSSTDRASLYSYLNTKWSVAGGTTPVTATRTTTWNVAAGPLTFSDNFNRADGALGSNWVAVSGVPDLPPISGNHVVVSGLGVNNAAVPVGTFGANQWARVACSLGPDYSEAGVILHTSDANNVMSFIYTINGMPYGPGVFGSIVGPAIQMYFIEGGTPRFLAEASTSGTGTHVVYGVNVGRVFQLWFDGVRVPGFNVDDSAHTTLPLTASPGFTIHQATAGTPTICDDFSGGDFVAATPTLSSLSPSSALPGATITLTGTNFVTDATMVTFDGVSYAVAVASATSGTFVVPTHAAATVSVTCTTPGGTSGSQSLTITSATTPVTASRSTTWAVLTPVATTRATTWSVLVPVTGVTRVTTWLVRSPVTSARTTTWAVLTPVSAASRTATWFVRSPVLSARTTTWTTLAPVTPVATRATTWKVALNAQASRSTTWGISAVVTASRAATWNTLSISGVAAARATTWNVSAPVGTASRTTTWLVRAPVAAGRSTTWNVAGATTTVTTSRSTTWNVLTPIAAATRATTWNVLASLATPATRSTTWFVKAPVLTARTTTWNVLIPPGVVLVSRTTTWNVSAPITPASKSTTWNVYLPVVGTATRTTTWAVLTPVSTVRTTTWLVRFGVSTTRTTTWAVLTNVTTNRVASWNALHSLTTSRVTTWAVLTPITAAVRTTTWATLRSIAGARSTTWRVAAPTTVVMAFRVTLWVVRSRTSASRTTTWRVLPSSPQHDYLTLYPDTVMYLGNHRVLALYQGSTKVWP